MSIERMEALVRLLTPPSCREHVLGDLRERAGTNPSGRSWRYAREAALTVPVVLWSQTWRRLTTLTVAEGLLTLGTVYVSFYGAPLKAAQLILTHPQGLASLSLLALMAVATRVLVDVFGAVDEVDGAKHERRRLTLGLAIPLLINLVLSRVAAGWALPLRPAFFALFFATAIVAPLRVLGRKNDRAATSADLHPFAIPRDMQALERYGRRFTLMGLVMGISAGAFFFRLAIVFSGSVARVGAAMTAIGALYMAYQAIRIRPRARLAGDTEDARSAYRSELERRRDFHGGSWLWWRLAVLLPGPLVMTIGRALSNPEQVRFNLVMAGFFLVFGILAIPLNLRMGREYQRRIDEVDGLESL